MDLLPEYPDLFTTVIPTSFPKPEELQKLAQEKKNKQIAVATLYAREHFTPRMKELAALGCYLVVLRLPDGYDRRSFLTAFVEQNYHASVVPVYSAWMTLYEANPAAEQESATSYFFGHRALTTDATDVVWVLIVDLRPTPKPIRYRSRPPPFLTRLRNFFCCKPAPLSCVEEEPEACLVPQVRAIPVSEF
jgi:hypothetical protein